jgi:hypothetical protein
MFPTTVPRLIGAPSGWDDRRRTDGSVSDVALRVAGDGETE